MPPIPAPSTVGEARNPRTISRAVSTFLATRSLMISPGGMRMNSARNSSVCFLVTRRLANSVANAT